MRFTWFARTVRVSSRFAQDAGLREIKRAVLSQSRRRQSGRRESDRSKARQSAELQDSVSLMRDFGPGHQLSWPTGGIKF